MKEGVFIDGHEQRVFIDNAFSELPFNYMKNFPESVNLTLWLLLKI